MNVSKFEILENSNCLDHLNLRKMAIASLEEIEKAKKEEKKLEARIFKVSIDETGEKEIPATNLNTTLAHDVIHELALVTDRRGLIRAHDFRQAVFKFKDTDASKKMLCVGEIILNRLLYTFGKPYGGKCLVYNNSRHCTHISISQV